MKYVMIHLEEEEYKRVVKVKAGRTWRELLLSICEVSENGYKFE